LALDATSSRRSSSPFPLPLGFTSWAFNKPGGVPVDRNAVDTVANAAKRLGARSVAVQIGEGVTVGDVRALQARGLFVVGWGVCSSSTKRELEELDVDGFMPQIEGLGQYDHCVEALRAGAGARGPLALVTDYGGLGSRERCDVLRELGLRTVFVEAYADEGASHANLPHYLDELARPYGYDAGDLVPLVGTYRDEGPAAYPHFERYAPEYAVYLLEPMSPARLDEFATFSSSGGGEAMPTFKTAGEAREYVRKVVRLWEALITRPDPWARATNVRRIADAPDAAWTKAREKVAKALDDAGVPK
jgi:hypothetical protein